MNLVNINVTGSSLSCMSSLFSPHFLFSSQLYYSHSLCVYVCKVYNPKPYIASCTIYSNLFECDSNILTYHM